LQAFLRKNTHRSWLTAAPQCRGWRGADGIGGGGHEGWGGVKVRSGERSEIRLGGDQRTQNPKFALELNVATGQHREDSTEKKKWDSEDRRPIQAGREEKEKTTGPYLYRCAINRRVKN